MKKSLLVLGLVLVLAVLVVSVASAGGWTQLPGSEVKYNFANDNLVILKFPSFYKFWFVMNPDFYSLDDIEQLYPRITGDWLCSLYAGPYDWEAWGYEYDGPVWANGAIECYLPK